LRASSGDVGLGWCVSAHADDDDGGQGSVESSISAAIESVPQGVSRRSWYRTSTRQCGERRFGANPTSCLQVRTTELSLRSRQAAITLNRLCDSALRVSIPRSMVRNNAVRALMARLRCRDGRFAAPGDGKMRARARRGASCASRQKLVCLLIGVAEVCMDSGTPGGSS
jgi:hypothetical protein